MTKNILEKLVKKALTNLAGDWLIIGGTVLPLVGVEYRSTVDIDMLPLKSDGNDTMLALMVLADSLDLPVETINSAGLFFLKKIDNWEKRIVIHAESKKCRIYRPNFDLYLELKLARFSESDESDILAYLKWYKKQKLEVDSNRTEKIIRSNLKKAKSSNDRMRLEALLQKLK